MRKCSSSCSISGLSPLQTSSPPASLPCPRHSLIIGIFRWHFRWVWHSTLREGTCVGAPLHDTKCWNTWQRSFWRMPIRKPCRSYRPPAWSERLPEGRQLLEGRSFTAWFELMLDSQDRNHWPDDARIVFRSLRAAKSPMLQLSECGVKPTLSPRIELTILPMTVVEPEPRRVLSGATPRRKAPPTFCTCTTKPAGVLSTVYGDLACALPQSRVTASLSNSSVSPELPR